MSFPDPRTRSKQTFVSRTLRSSSGPTFTSLLLVNALQVFSLSAGKYWLLERDATTLWLAYSILQVAIIPVFGWAIFANAFSLWRKAYAQHGRSLAKLSVLLFVQQISLCVALHGLPPIRLLLFTQTWPFWLPHLRSPSAISATLLIALAILSSAFLDTRFSDQAHQSVLMSYSALGTYAISAFVALDDQAQLSLALGEWNVSGVTVSGAGLLAICANFLGFVTGRTALPQSIPALRMLVSIPVIALSSIFLFPSVTRTLNIAQSRAPTLHGKHPPARFIGPILLSLSAPLLLISYLAFASPPSISDLIVTGFLFSGIIIGRPRDGPTHTSFTRLARTYIKIILEKDDSRKIFYFLMVNLAYMVVQMMWGFWTNSLGLVSDAIHMFFDCLSVAVGLMASVMANWPPNERFTYGYGRIETISGFANGIFLVLISVFIVFEAIQRIIDPPEMGNFRQLLIVSTMGLGVNLFGLLAIGHHHHGPGHSHSHSHDEPSHSHGGHSHGAHESPSHTGHGHSHAADSPAAGHSHFHQVNGRDRHHHDEDCDSDHSSHDHSRSHVRGHGHSDPHSHSHSEPHSHSHSHSSHSDAEDHSPITPSYRYGHDDHDCDEHHSSPTKGQSHDHHGHSHNMQGVFLHVMADTLGSVGVIISTLLIEYYGWTGFDPIASLFIAILIAASVIPLVKDCGRVLCLDMGEKELSVRHALQELSNLDGVASYSEPSFWPKNAEAVVGSIHIQLAHSASAFDPAGPHSTVKSSSYVNIDRVMGRVDRLLKSKIEGLEELTIEVEGS